MQIPQKWSCGSFPQRRTLVRRWAPGRRQYRCGTARRKKGAVASTTTSEGIVGTTVGNFYIFASLVFVCICFYILNMFSFSPRPWDFTRICDRLTFMLWFGMRIFKGIVIHPTSQSHSQHGPQRLSRACVCVRGLLMADSTETPRDQKAAVLYTSELTTTWTGWGVLPRFTS